MIDQELIEGIKKHIERGDSKEVIQKHVLEAGHDRTTFEIAYSRANEQYKGNDSFIPTNTPVPTTSADTSSQVRQVNVTKLVLIIVVLLMFVGFSAFAYTQRHVITGLFRDGPYNEATLLSDVVTGFQKLESGVFSASVSVVSGELDQDTYLLPKELWSETDYDNLSAVLSLFPADAKFAAKLTSYFDRNGAEKMDNQVQVEGEFLTSDMTFNFDTEAIVTLQDGVYVKVNRMPSLFFLDFSPIRGKWVEYTDKPLEEAASSIRKIDPSGNDLTSQFELLLELAEKHAVIQLTELVTHETIDAGLAYKYSFMINHSGLKPFLKEATEQLDELYGEDSIFRNVNENEDLDRVTSKAYVDFLNDHVDLNLWARGDGVPVRLEVVNRLAVDDDVDLFGSARERGLDAAKQQTLSNMRAQAEIYGNQFDGTVDYRGFCDEYGSSLERGDSEYECVDNANAYAMAVALSDTSKCADSTGQLVDGWVNARTLTCDTETVIPVKTDENSEESEPDRQVELVFALDFNDINEPVTITPPEDFMTIDEAAKKVPALSAFSPEAMAAQEEQTVSGRLLGIRSILERYRNDNGGYSGACDYLTQELSMQSFFDTNDAYCYDSASSFVVEASVNDTYYCSDSTGFSGETIGGAARQNYCQQ